MSDATTQPEALPWMFEHHGTGIGTLISQWADAPQGERAGTIGDAIDAAIIAYATEHAAKLHAECEALWAAFNAACAFIDCHVGDWDLTKEMVSKHAAFVKARAELAARAAKEKSNG